MDLENYLKHYLEYQNKSVKEIQNEIKPILDKCNRNVKYMHKLAEELNCTYHCIMQWRKKLDPFKPNYEKYLRLLIMIEKN